MIDIDFERLRALGLHATMAQAVQQLIADFASQTPDFAAQDWQLMRVCTVHRDRLQVHDGLSERSATTLPRLAKQHALDGTSIAVGDWVLTQTPEPERCWVHAVLPPVTRINRRDADGSRHAVVSNVDTALLVMGLDLDFSLRRLERYLALVQGSGVWPVVVLTKLDTLGETAWARSERLVDIARQLRERLPPEVIVYALDARSPEVAQDLAPYLRLGQTLVLLGSSGAGKSTLTNSLAGMGLQDTGPVREHDSRGRHTTTARTLLPLLSGACLIDARCAQPAAGRRCAIAKRQLHRHQRAGWAMPLSQLPARQRAGLRGAGAGVGRPGAQLSQAQARNAARPADAAGSPARTGALEADRPRRP